MPHPTSIRRAARGCVYALLLATGCDASKTSSEGAPRASSSAPMLTAVGSDGANPSTPTSMSPGASSTGPDSTGTTSSTEGDETPAQSTGALAGTTPPAGSSSAAADTSAASTGCPADPSPIASGQDPSAAGGTGSLPPNTDAGSSGQHVEPADIPWIPVDELPEIEELPDPLTMYDGTKVTTEAQWRARRQEMIQLLEDYEYGHMPPPPGNVSAEVTTESTAVDGDVGALYRGLHLTFGPDESLGFDLGVFTPTGQGEETGAPEGGYPTLISLGFGSGESSLASARVAIERGYAVVTLAFSQLGADSPDYASTAFFPAYPDYDWRDFSAWAWGLSRAVDYLVTDPEIDASKLMITGVSRLAQAVLLAGAFDERIALTAPVAGGMALRFSGREQGEGLGQGITEVVDQNTYWFGPHFEEFRNQTDKLPCDQHWLPALTAPRLFIMANSLQDEYGRAYAAVQTYLGAKPVYEFLGADQNIGVSFREGGHGMTGEDWSAILDFADQYLLQKAGDRRFDVLPPDDKLP